MGKIYLSVIQINSWFCETAEMYIPFKVGQVLRGFRSITRLDRLLAVGNRLRGDFELYEEEKQHANKILKDV